MSTGKPEPHHVASDVPRLEGQREFVRLWTSASRRVHSFILTLVMNWADAEDLLQDVGVTAWEKFDEFDRSGDFVRWACGIAKYKVMSFNQLAGRRTVVSSELVDRIAEAIQADAAVLQRQHEALQTCVSLLNDEDRQLLRLRYMPGLPIRVLAEETGRSVEAIYKSLQRIYHRLGECVSRRLLAWGDR